MVDTVGDAANGIKRRHAECCHTLGDLTNKRRRDDDKVCSKLPLCKELRQSRQLSIVLPIGSPEASIARSANPSSVVGAVCARLLDLPEDSRPSFLNGPKFVHLSDSTNSSPGSLAGSQRPESDFESDEPCFEPLPCAEDSNLVQSDDSERDEPAACLALQKPSPARRRIISLSQSIDDIDDVVIIAESPVSAMPDEILLLIFSLMPYSVKELAGLKYVCRQWRRVISDMSLVRNRPLERPQYQLDIMLRDQKGHALASDFLSSGVQVEINEDMRAILVDWLVEVSQEFRLHDETLFLGVSLVDQFMGRKRNSLPRHELQLLGLAALLIAAKFEEIYPPLVADLIYVADNIYTRQELLTMEERVLDLLGFDLPMYTLKHFLLFFLSMLNTNWLERASPLPDVVPRIFNYASYLAEVALLSYELALERPSMVATAAVCVALHAFGIEPWEFLLHPTVRAEHPPEDVKGCADLILELAVKNQAQNAGATTEGPKVGPLVAVHDKYTDERFHRSSLRPLPEPLRFDRFA